MPSLRQTSGVVTLSPQEFTTLIMECLTELPKELAVDNRPGIIGFSVDMGVKIAKLSINYGIASFHLAATAHYFSLATNLSQFVH